MCQCESMRFQLFVWWIYVILSTLKCELLNQYESDGVNYWASLTPFIPIRNATYGKIQIKPKMFFQFDMYWYNLVENGTDHENIFRIGNNGIDIFGCNENAHRYPALYINKYTKGLQVGISDTDDCWGNHYQSIQFTFTENTSYKFLMEFTDTTLVILVNGIPIYTGNRPGSTPNDTLWSLVDVIISDPLNTAANCTITNFLILSYETIKSMYPTTSPTAPTASPSFAPTLSTQSPTTSEPSQNPTITPTPYPTESTLSPSKSTTQKPTFHPIMVSTTILPTEYDMYSVDIAITLNYNSSLTLDENKIIQISDIISTLIKTNNDIDVSQLFVSTKHNIETHQLIINVVYNTLNELEAHILLNYILNNLSEQLLDELDHKFDGKIVLIDVTDNDTNINEEESNPNSTIWSTNEQESDTKILWIFDQQTIWYLLFGILVAFIIVIIGCCILYFRYDALIKKNRNSERTGIENNRLRLPVPPQIQIAKTYSNEVVHEGEYKYHWNKNNQIGDEYDDEKSPNMNDEDKCLVSQPFDIGNSASTIKSSQLTNKKSLYSASDMSSVIVVDGVDQRRSIKIVQPQYYNDSINDNSNVQTVPNERNSNNSAYTDGSDEHDYLDNDNCNSSSNESMYDPNLSRTERTRTKTNDAHETML